MKELPSDKEMAEITLLKYGNMKEQKLLVTDLDIKIEAFKNREVRAKNVFTLREVEKTVAYSFVLEHHYLKEAKFFAKYCYGIFIDHVMVGCATYSNPQGIVAMKSWFGLENDNQDVLELSRLCMLPQLNGTNATSYLLGNSLKLLKSKEVKAVITLADASRHVGSIYQVCNFKYYGLTDKKTDFYTADGRTNPRGQTKDIRGVWLPRTQKHRYCYMLGDGLNCLLEEQIKPNASMINSYECCNQTNRVFDKRFKEWYSCPKCTNTISLLNED
jgi:hypothetical protein